MNEGESATSEALRNNHASAAGTKPKSSPTPPKMTKPTPATCAPAPSMRAMGEPQCKPECAPRRVLQHGPSVASATDDHVAVDSSSEQSICCVISVSSCPEKTSSVESPTSPPAWWARLMVAPRVCSSVHSQPCSHLDKGGRGGVPQTNSGKSSRVQLQIRDGSARTSAAGATYRREPHRR